MAANTGNGGQLAVIDLHGQHVAEALKLLRREVTRLRGQNRQPAKAGNRTIQILVGTNHHSKVPSSCVITFTQHCTENVDSSWGEYVDNKIPLLARFEGLEAHSES